MFSFNLDPILVVNWVIAVLLPLLVAVFTTKLSDSWKKALLLAFLTTLSALLGEAVRAWQSGQAYDLGTALFTLFTALALAWGAYTNIWKPTGVSAKVQAQIGAKERPAG